MGLDEAREDGIRTGKVGSTGVYYPPCRICGKEQMSYSYIRKNVYACPACRALMKRMKACGLDWKLYVPQRKSAQ